MKKFLVVLFILLYVSSSIATTCPQPVSYLKEGTTVPCTGYLFDPEKEQEVRIKLEELKYKDQIIIVQKHLLDIKDQRIDNLSKYNEYLDNKLQTNENLSFWKSTLYFSLGVLVTGFIARNIR